MVVIEDHDGIESFLLYEDDGDHYLMFAIESTRVQQRFTLDPDAAAELSDALDAYDFEADAAVQADDWGEL